ncbi:unnamed protein product [Durusdinium trenchii]|uniref:Uncharacterized protein n=1 Tax=Durusdinium trenchii TaxID=1381693 RepID=A0ABP0J131_9DINO
MFGMASAPTTRRASAESLRTDSFMGLLASVSLFSLFQMAFLKRKSNSFSGLMHTATGAMQIGIVLYAIIEDRCKSIDWRCAVGGVHVDHFHGQQHHHVAFVEVFPRARGAASALQVGLFLHHFLPRPVLLGRINIRGSTGL